jgi:hypothetical protein
VAATAGAAGRAARLHSPAQRTCMPSASGRGLDVASPHRERKQLQRGCRGILQAAPQYQQTRVLTRVERIRRAGSGAKAKLVWLIVITRPVAVQRTCDHDVIRGGERGHLRGNHPSRPGSRGSGGLVSTLCARRRDATSVSMCPIPALRCAAVRFVKSRPRSHLRADASLFRKRDFVLQLKSRTPAKYRPMVRAGLLQKNDSPASFKSASLGAPKG